MLLAGRTVLVFPFISRKKGHGVYVFYDIETEVGLRCFELLFGCLVVCCRVVKGIFTV